MNPLIQMLLNSEAMNLTNLIDQMTTSEELHQLKLVLNEARAIIDAKEYKLTLDKNGK